MSINTESSPAAEVLQHAAEYRQLRHLVSVARTEGDARTVASMAARCGTALRRMRKAAAEHNRRAA